MTPLRFSPTRNCQIPSICHNDAKESNHLVHRVLFLLKKSMQVPKIRKLQGNSWLVKLGQHMNTAAFHNFGPWTSQTGDCQELVRHQYYISVYYLCFSLDFSLYWKILRMKVHLTRIINHPANTGGCQVHLLGETALAQPWSLRWMAVDLH